MNLEKLLEEIEQEFGLDNIHITRHCGSFVVVKDKKVIRIAGERLHFCPILSRIYNLDIKPSSSEQISSVDIKKTIQEKVDKFGMFCEEREVCCEHIAIPFGASEIMMYGLRNQVLDAVVSVCEGAGTVISDNPVVVQGIGARMNGIFYSSAIPEVIKKLENNKAEVPFPGKIDQVKGVEYAINSGYKKIAVTINGFDADNLENIKELKKHIDVKITSLLVCTTGVSQENAVAMLDADIVWGCASKCVRKIVAPKSVLQIGVQIPVFVLNENGLELISCYAKNDEIRKTLAENKNYYVTFMPHGAYKKIEMGKFKVYLHETDSYPVRAHKEPKPLL